MNLKSKRLLQCLLLLACAFVMPLPAAAVESSSEAQQRQQTTTVNGRVMSLTGEPIAGVTVLIKGTQSGTATNSDGVYTINVPDQNTVLLFQFMGYQKQEIRVGSMININVNLKEVATDLNEVVVVGYGSQKKASIIGSISTIQPTLLQQGTTRSLSNNLAGQLAGVIAVQRSGEPGHDDSNFWIRGVSSFGAGTSPLVLVDGIERNLNDINPAEIESFSVLKDASASAVYGVRGANGVIIITTKRGTMGKPKVTLSYEYAITAPVKLPQYIGSVDYLTLLDELSVDAGLDPLYKDVIPKYRDKVDNDLYPDVNWVDAITNDFASNHRMNLSVNGGNEFVRYSLIGSYYGENGVIVRDKSQNWDPSVRLDKFNLRSNVDVNITKSTIARISIGGYLQDGTAPASGISDIFGSAFETPPYIHPERYSNGLIPREKSRSNPWARATQEGFYTYTKSKIESLFSVEQHLDFLTKGLMIKGMFSFDRFSEAGVKRTKSPFYYAPATQRDPETNELILGTPDQGQEFLGYEKTQEWGNRATYFEANLSYGNSFGAHQVDALILFNRRDYQDGSIVPYRRMGMAGRASYSYDSRYVAEFNFGYNGSENFAKGNRFGFFPSVAAGWLLSEEKFMSKYKSTFSKIKFRGSWGLVGNDQLSGRRFAYISTISAGGEAYRFGETSNIGYQGFYEGHFGNTNMTWETVEKINVGVELGLWNALDLQVDWFVDHRTDIFMQRKNIPTAAGFQQTPYANFGRVDNSGVDLSLMFHKQFSKDWFFSLRGTFTYAKNKIIDQDEAPGILGTNRSSTNYPVGQLFGLVDEGLFTEDDFEDVATGKLKPGIPSQNFSSSSKVRPGDIKYRDMDEDGAITTKDVAPIGGTYNPEIIYGIGASVRFKGLDFNIFLQGNGKTYRFIGGNYFLPGSGLGNFLSNYNDRWTPENPRQDAFYPRLSNTMNENNTQNSTWWLRNMSMLRLKDVELGYNIPERSLRKIGLSNIRVFVRGTNLLTFSEFKLWDPEVDSSNGAMYPIMRSLSLGIDIGF